MWWKDRSAAALPPGGNHDTTKRDCLKAPVSGEPLQLNRLEVSLESNPGTYTRQGACGPDYSNTGRNLAMELVRVTEAAALQAGKWVGMGGT